MQAAAKTTLASLVEEHLTSLVQEAAAVSRHSKRARYHACSDQDGVLRNRIHAEDVNLALQWRGSEKLYATSVVVPPGPGEDPTTEPVDLNAYLKSENRLRPPSEVGLTSHWLAVDGTQPPIPQNPVKRSIHRVEGDDEAAALDQELTMEEKLRRGVSVRQLLPRLLSEELQLYFTRVTIAIERGGSDPTAREQQDAALGSLSRDAGLQELLPFFVRYVSQQLYQHVDHPEHCRTLVRMIRSLFSNPQLHLELHLHQILPALITCVVAKKLSASRLDNHWALRQEAAQTLLQACNLFSQEYSTLKARVLKTLYNATASDKPLTTIYGGLVGTSLFGAKAVDAFLVPLIIPYWHVWDEKLQSVTEEGDDLEIMNCQQALLNALGLFLQRVNPEEKAARISMVDLEETFGDQLVALYNEPTEYAFCVV